MKIPAHERTITIGGSLDHATETEHETIECDAVGQTVNSADLLTVGADGDLAFECPACDQTLTPTGWTVVDG